MRIIDADECLKELKDHVNASDMPTMWYTGIMFAEHHINVAPTVEAVPVVHSRWKCISIGRYACSLCGFEPWYEGSINTLRYCPNCGARMDGERKDNG